MLLEEVMVNLQTMEKLKEALMANVMLKSATLARDVEAAIFYGRWRSLGDIADNHLLDRDDRQKILFILGTRRLIEEQKVFLRVIINDKKNIFRQLEKIQQDNLPMAPALNFIYYALRDDENCLSFFIKELFQSDLDEHFANSIVNGLMEINQRYHVASGTYKKM
jgi:hypothetical protein